ncbi:ATP-binding cassette [Mactra antiquata]
MASNESDHLAIVTRNSARLNLSGKSRITQKNKSLTVHTNWERVDQELYLASVNEQLSNYNPVNNIEDTIKYLNKEPVLFATSVLENMRYGRPDATDTEVYEAVTLANAHDFIDGFPEEYNTILGERGVTVSGGQKHGITIARALIKNPSIFLLDEATSALDAESERIVQEALDTVSRGCTVLVIAHRLSTIRDADIIAVVSHGQIVEITSDDLGLTRVEGIEHVSQSVTEVTQRPVSDKSAVHPLVSQDSRENLSKTLNGTSIIDFSRIPWVQEELQSEILEKEEASVKILKKAEADASVNKCRYKSADHDIADKPVVKKRHKSYADADEKSACSVTTVTTEKDFSTNVHEPAKQITNVSVPHVPDVNTMSYELDSITLNSTFNFTTPDTTVTPHYQMPMHEIGPVPYVETPVSHFEYSQTTGSQSYLEMLGEIKRLERLMTMSGALSNGSNAVSNTSKGIYGPASTSSPCMKNESNFTLTPSRTQLMMSSLGNFTCQQRKLKEKSGLLCVTLPPCTRKMSPMN